MICIQAHTEDYRNEVPSIDADVHVPLLPIYDHNTHELSGSVEELPADHDSDSDSTLSG